MDVTSTQVLTSIGCVLIVWGIACAALAYYKNMTEHARWLVAQRRLRAVRAWIIKLPARLAFWRQQTSVTLDVHSARHGHSAGHVTLTGSGHGEAIPADETTEQKIERLFKRVERAQQEIRHLREQHGKRLDALSTEIGKLDQRVREADEEVKDLARGLALDTVPLQMRGLIFVGVGTLLAAFPAIASW